MSALITSHKRWVEAADHRHAIDGPPARPGDHVVSLCRRTIVVVVTTPGRPAPECPDCDHEWRDLDGIPQRDSHIRTRAEHHQPHRLATGRTNRSVRLGAALRRACRRA